MLAGALCATLLAFLWAFSTQQDQLRVDFLDVGQGDSTLITSPTDTQVLVDGGKAGKAGRSLAKALPFFDRSLDVVIGTHADSDHVGGLVNVLKNYDVSTVVLPQVAASSSVYQALETAAREEQKSGAEITTLSRGDVLDIGAGAYMLVQFPPAGNAPVGTNDSSLIFTLVYGETKFLFTGDSPQVIEEYLALSQPDLLQADVLKVGHHGSDTSSSYPFLSAVGAQSAVISAGADNPYGHPDEVVVDRLQRVGAKILCTCDIGTISFLSDGQSVYRR